MSEGLRPAAGIGVVDEGDVVYAATLPDGPIVVLDDIAAMIWSAACDGPRHVIADRVAAATGAPIEEIRVHVESFVDSLVARGLLEPDVSPD
jgi:hypothetical protein